jgi:hypothetical protein
MQMSPQVLCQGLLDATSRLSVPDRLAVLENTSMLYNLLKQVRNDSFINAFNGNHCLFNAAIQLYKMVLRVTSDDDWEKTITSPGRTLWNKSGDMALVCRDCGMQFTVGLSLRAYVDSNTHLPIKCSCCGSKNYDAVGQENGLISHFFS